MARVPLWCNWMDSIPPRSTLVLRCATWADNSRHAAIMLWTRFQETDRYRGAAAYTRAACASAAAHPRVVRALAAAAAYLWQARVLLRRLKIIWDALPSCKVNKLKDLHGVRGAVAQLGECVLLHSHPLTPRHRALPGSALRDGVVHVAGIGVDNTSRPHKCAMHASCMQRARVCVCRDHALAAVHARRHAPCVPLECKNIVTADVILRARVCVCVCVCVCVLVSRRGRERRGVWRHFTKRVHPCRLYSGSGCAARARGPGAAPAIRLC
jgi:hypothetical protein